MQKPDLVLDRRIDNRRILQTVAQRFVVQLNLSDLRPVEVRL